MTTYTWIGVTGPWTAASFWTVDGATNGSVPGAGDDAIIAAAGTYTVTVDTVTMNNLTVSDPAATLQIESGSVSIDPLGEPHDIPNVLTVASTTNAGTIDIAGNAMMVSGAGTFVNTGTIVIKAGTNTGAATLEVEGNYTTAGLGSIDNAGGQLVLQGTLDNIGSVFSASDLTGLAGSVAFENCFIEGGTLDFGTAEISVSGGVLDGVTVLGALDPDSLVENGLTVLSASGTSPGTINLSNGSQLIFVDSETLDNVNIEMGGNTGGISVEAGQTLTLGANSFIDAAPAQISSGISGSALVADGLIVADGPFGIGANTVVNNGIMRSIGGPLYLGGTTPTTNAAFIEVYGGGIVEAGSITGSGTILLGSGTVDLTGEYGQQTFSFSGSGNRLNLDVVAGTNTVQDFLPGDTIELVGTPVTVNYASGTLAIDAGATTLANFVMQGAPTTAQFSTTTDTSNDTFITETFSSSTYTWRGGAGTWTTASQWTVDGTSTGAIPGYGPADTALIAAAGTYAIGLATSETIGNLDVSNANATVAIASTLGVGVAGIGTIQNAGVITLDSNASLLVNGDYALAGLGTIENSGGTITLGGTLQNAGLVLKASDFGGVAFGTISIEGGTLELDNGTPILNGTLDGVTVQGTLAPGRLAVRNGLTVETLGGGQPGLIETGSASSLEFLDSETLDNTTISMGEGNITIDAGQTLTLGPHSRLTVPGNALIPPMIDGPGSGAATLISEGTIDTAGQLDIGTTGTLAFTNTGLVKSTAEISIAATNLSNTGTILANSSYLFLSATGMMTNSGLMLADGGQIIPGGNVVANSGTIISEANSIVFLDPASPSNAGEMLAENFGSFHVTQNLAGAGTIALANTGTFTLDGSYDRQTFAFTGTANTLALATLAGTNTVQGFSPGNTIEVESTPVSVNFAAGTLAIQSGSITLADFAMSGVPANAQFSVAIDGGNNSFITETIPCFAAGTRILTASGEVPVEALRVGDHVVTLRGHRLARIIWLGHRHVDCRAHPRPHDVLPIRIKANTLAPGVPHRDLRLSPDHAVLVASGAGKILVPARHLLNGTTIAQHPCETITYWHVETASHDAVLAEGLAAETYLDTGNRAHFAHAPATTVQPSFAGIANSK